MEQLIYSNILIKFFEKRKWANSFRKGNLYINEAGKFITEENNFRGDDYEGSHVVSFENTILVQFKNEANGETIQIPLQPKTPIKQSFVGAKKVPIFCAARLNETNFIKIGSDEYKIAEDFISYMEQFGSFAVIFDKRELLNKINKKADILNVPVASGNVQYQNYDNEFKHFENIKEQYEQFFCKYISDDRNYDKQNEWRVLLGDTKLIDNKHDHFELGIGKLKYATQVIETKYLKKGVFHFNAK